MKRKKVRRKVENRLIERIIRNNKYIENKYSKILDKEHRKWNLE